MYKKEYDKQKEKYGEIVEKYKLAPPPEILILLGEIALKGIIAGASFEALLKIVEKIKNKENSEDLKRKIEEMPDEELEEFYNYIKKEYQTRKKSKKLERKIREKIRD